MSSLIFLQLFSPPVTRTIKSTSQSGFVFITLYLNHRSWRLDVIPVPFVSLSAPSPAASVYSPLLLSVFSQAFFWQHTCPCGVRSKCCPSCLLSFISVQLLCYGHRGTWLGNLHVPGFSKTQIEMNSLDKFNRDKCSDCFLWPACRSFLRWSPGRLLFVPGSLGRAVSDKGRVKLDRGGVLAIGAHWVPTSSLLHVHPLQKVPSQPCFLLQPFTLFLPVPQPTGNPVSSSVFYRSC